MRTRKNNRKTRTRRRRKTRQRGGCINGSCPIVGGGCKAKKEGESFY